MSRFYDDDEPRPRRRREQQAPPDQTYSLAQVVEGVAWVVLLLMVLLGLVNPYDRELSKRAMAARQAGDSDREWALIQMQMRERETPQVKKYETLSTCFMVLVVLSFMVSFAAMIVSKGTTASGICFCLNFVPLVVAVIVTLPK